MMGGDRHTHETKAKVPHAFSGTQLGKLPIPEDLEGRTASGATVGLDSSHG